MAVDETFHARHPERSSLTAGLADAYADAAARTGAAVERLTLRELDFDPVLHLGLPHGAGRSARFIMPADSPGFYLALVQGNPTRKQVARSTLTFCGFSPVHVTRFSPVRTASDTKGDRWIAKVGGLAAKDVGRCGRQRKARTDPFEIRRTLTADAS